MSDGAFDYDKYVIWDEKFTEIVSERMIVDEQFVPLEILLQFAFMLLLSFLSYSTIRANQRVQTLREIVKRYARQNFSSSMSNEGCAMEYRIAYDFYPTALGLVSMQNAHYLYLLPLVPTQLLATDDNASEPEDREVV